ncbi:hypothetical protein FB381_1905 [Nocardioides albertanoniae]|uniref:Ferritin-like metal-binding protein YciE n=1 Tax=Nocardioides albertanoniae TaxID=1175486 RepID=A0A543A6A4_9ACTN|nr:hypothetical protein [Nocardioides albertanoniae]TQL68016.1 hypothetical protein FB381_1905 [Nocardioides albertanoniae]
MSHLATYVGLADHSEQTLASALRSVAEGHAEEADVFHTCHLLAGWSEEHRRRLAPVVERYGEEDVEEPERLHHDGLAQVRSGPVGLLRDLQELYVLGAMVETTWTVVIQGAQGLRDTDLLEVATSCSTQTARQLSWFNTRMKVAAPQALIVAR